MPRKTKEKIDEKEKIIDEKKVVKKKSPAKKTSSSKSSNTKSTEKKVAAKKTTSRKSALAKIIESIDVSEEKAVASPTKKKAASVKKAPASKKASANSTKSSSAKTKKASTSKAAKSKPATTRTASSKESTKKASVKKQSNKKTTTKKKSTKKENQSNNTSIQVAEYYDLPYKYGNTVVKLLAQTPNTLFVYWEVSDDDIDNFKKVYGDDFYNKSTPILIVHNLTLNKTYEVEINDFANCWYLNTEDTDCKFDIELARRFNPSSYEKDGNIEADYLYVAASNNLNSPNDHILFEKIKEFVVFRNVSNDNVIKKNVKSLKFLKDLYKFYKDMYDEDVLNNPSSQFKF